MTKYAQGYSPTSDQKKETVSGDSTIVSDPKEISISTPSKNSTTKKVVTGIVVGGIVGGGISYLINKKFVVSAAIIGAIVGAVIYNKYQK